MFDSEFQEIENDEANRVRRHHLEVYQGIVGEFPIINYLTSREPKATELAFAAKELKRNATNELNEIKQLVQQLETKKDDFIDTKFNRLTEYRLLVEEVLLENPQYCAVASSAYGTQARRDTQHTVMAMAPILAASFFAPPLAAMGVALAGTSALAVRSTNEREATIQAAYGTAINDGYSSKKQADVDKAQRQMLTDVALVPTSALGFGVFAKGREMYMQSLSKAK